MKWTVKQKYARIGAIADYVREHPGLMTEDLIQRVRNLPILQQISRQKLEEYIWILYKQGELYSRNGRGWYATEEAGEP